MQLDFVHNAEQYYYTHFDELMFSQKFHFASRMFTWKADLRAADLLQNLKKDYINLDDGQSRSDQLHAIITKPQTGRRIAHELRTPYFAKYPDLYGVEHALFKIRHLLEIYNIDIRKAFSEVYPMTRLDSLRQTLAEDHDALRALSSFAVNFFYIADILFGHSPHSPSPQDWLAVGQEYDFSCMEHLQLFIYLYTHCIIADSNFYARPVTTELIPIYTTMLQGIEQAIADNFTLISLDNKLEFLVAAQMCDYSTNLTEKIYDEVRISISPEGPFVIEAHNANLRPDRQTFQKSEHRTTLLIMSASRWQHSTPLKD